ncbi:MAG: sigma 54-interacting transcriptional regulator [Clostridia bacterium]|nr:sigma 54-interacting transcriptional regulator [Clostridia bacterium]
MDRKKIVVATLYENAAKVYSEQIKEIFSDYVEVKRYSFFDKNIEKSIDADLVIIPSTLIFELVKKHVTSNSQIIVVNRTLSKAGFDKINDLPKNTRAMLVNVSVEMAVETISLIYQLGVKDIDLTPVYPNIKTIPPLDMAITPGEPQNVPKEVKEIIDIGDRVLDISTIIDIASILDLNEVLEKKSTKQHFNKIVPISLGLEKILGKTSQLEGQFNILLGLFDEGIIGINSNGVIHLYSEGTRKIIGYRQEEVVGSNAMELFPQIPFNQVFKTSKAVKEKLIKIKETDIVVTVVPIIKSKTLYGAVAILRKFSDTEKKQHKLRAQLIGKGHRAKYCFEDILGKGLEINKCKNIGKRMAKSNSSILITGESGTGKELFAQAIHNSSPRKDYQFVAINCAALPESLLESELFGYEEGAFTGARRGGKLGLFELAHMGTLFLDEIGEMPLKVQARLLRTLQEKEVMRIGGDSVIDIDVRIIAATNRDLKELCDKGQFRKDLYFRLNVLPLRIPPLRERKGDIPLLINEFVREFNSDFSLSEKALIKFMEHGWEGNIRELRNYIEYLTNLGEKLVEVDNLPFKAEDKSFSLKEKDSIDKIEDFINKAGEDLNKYILILQELEKNYYKQTSIGRRSLSKAISLKGEFLTEQEIRTILLKLKNFSMVEIKRGRGGTKITKLGLEALNYIGQ